MKKIVKSSEEDATDFSRFSHLPDEIILQILNKLIDLKTLCFCYLVSKRFSSIVLQVDTISLTTPVSSSPLPDNSTFGGVAPSKLRHHPISSCHYQSLRYALTLEEVSITDSGRRGRLSMTGGKLAEVKEWLHPDSETVESEMEPTTAPVSLSLCYIPGLELPVSGYVMKGITLVVIDMNDLQGGNGGPMISEDGFEDKEEAAYTEAVMEILKNHKSMMHMVI